MKDVASIRKIRPRSAEVLIRELDEYQMALYPPECNHLESLDAMEKDDFHLFGCYEQESLIGIGGVKIRDEFGYGDIKRVYVPEVHRGKGAAKAVMGRIEEAIRNCGLLSARLETGIYQPEAISLYKHLGYQECRAFPPYEEDPFSVFMRKELG